MILNHLLNKEVHISLADLTESFQVSERTIRNEVKYLNEDGIKKWLSHPNTARTGISITDRKQTIIHRLSQKTNRQLRYAKRFAAPALLRTIIIPTAGFHHDRSTCQPASSKSLDHSARFEAGRHLFTYIRTAIKAQGTLWRPDRWTGKETPSRISKAAQHLFRTAFPNGGLPKFPKNARHPSIDAIH